MCECVSRQPQYFWARMPSGNHYKKSTDLLMGIHALPARHGNSLFLIVRLLLFLDISTIDRRDRASVSMLWAAFFFLPFQITPLSPVSSTLILPFGILWGPSLPCWCRAMLHTWACTAFRDEGSLQSSWLRPETNWKGEFWFFRSFCPFFFSFKHILLSTEQHRNSTEYKLLSFSN